MPQQSAPRKRHPNKTTVAKVVRTGIKLLNSLPDPLILRVAKFLSGSEEPEPEKQLDPQLAFFLKLIRPLKRTELSHGDVSALRRDIDLLLYNLGERQPFTGVITESEIPSASHKIPIRIYQPKKRILGAALVYFHGGGGVIGSLDSHEFICRALALYSEITVIAVDYRLGPEHRHPAAFEDCLHSYLYIRKNARAFGLATERIAVGGDSAGGTFAAGVSQTVKDMGFAAPHFQVLLYPMLDPTHSTLSYQTFAKGYLLESSLVESFWKLYLPPTLSRFDPSISPLSADSLSGLPPTLIVTAGFDPLRDEGEIYAKALEKEGVPTIYRCADGMLHSFLHLYSCVDAVFFEMKNISSLVKNAMLQDKPFLLTGPSTE